MTKKTIAAKISLVFAIGMLEVACDGSVPPPPPRHPEAPAGPAPGSNESPAPIKSGPPSPSSVAPTSAPPKPAAPPPARVAATPASVPAPPPPPPKRERIRMFGGCNKPVRLFFKRSGSDLQTSLNTSTYEEFPATDGDVIQLMDETGRNEVARITIAASMKEIHISRSCTGFEAK